MSTGTSSCAQTCSGMQMKTRMHSIVPVTYAIVR